MKRIDTSIMPTQSSRDADEVNGDWQRQISEILSVLNHAFPRKKLRWHERLYSKVQDVAKYIGIPALVLASVTPIANLFETYREYKNKRYLVETYTNYATVLTERGFMERAASVLDDLDKAKDRDVKTQYASAKVLAMTAISQGKGHQLAQDRIELLLGLHKNRDVFFPRLGGEDEVFDLELALADIALQLGNYKEAESRLKALEASQEVSGKPLFAANIQLRRGTLNVLQYKFADAKQNLEDAISVFRKDKLDKLVAEAEFQLAKAYQFKNDMPKAIEHYESARKIFEQRTDRFSLLRVYNNLAMIYLARRDNSKAEYFFRSSERLARQTRDDLGVARAVYNLALIAKRRGEYGEAIKKTLEAQEAFRIVDNKTGLAATYQNLADVYSLTEDYERAFHNAAQAATIFEDLQEVRGVAATYGTLSLLARRLENNEEAVYYSFGSLVLRRYLRDQEYLKNVHELEALKGLMTQEEFESAVFLATFRLRDTAVRVGAHALVSGSFAVYRP